MKILKLIFKFTLVLGISSTSLFSSENDVIISLQDLETIYDLKCLNGIYHIDIEIDGILQPVPLFKIIDNEEVFITCNSKS